MANKICMYVYHSLNSGGSRILRGAKEGRPQSLWPRLLTGYLGGAMSILSIH